MPLFTALSRWGLAAIALLVGVAIATITPPDSALGTVPSTAIRYVYDGDSQLTAVVKPSTEKALYGWDPAGNLTSIGLSTAKKLSVIQVTPGRAPVGTSVTIYGSGFSKTATSNTVKFNGTAATVVTASEWALIVTVPGGATSGTVTVQTGTEGPATSAQSFTVGTAPPVISSLSTSIAAPGQSVTLAGFNFETALLGDRAAINRSIAKVTAASPTSLTLTVPAAIGSGHVSVATPRGAATGPDLYVPPNGIPVSKVGATGRTALGSSATVKLPVAEKVGLEIFDGVAGQRVSILTSEDTIPSGLISIWGPQGQQVGGLPTFFTSGSQVLLEPVTLPNSGTYTVLVSPEGTGTGNVKLSLYSVVDATAAVTPTSGGATTAVSLGTPGQNGRYTVSGTEGEVVSVKTASTAFSGEYNIEWFNPEGTRIAVETFSGTTNAFPEPVTFPTAGTYTLVINPIGAATGSTSLTAYNASPVTGTVTPSAGGGAITTTIVAPGQTARIGFEGTAGQRISTVYSENTITGEAAILEPGGGRLSGVGITSGFESYGAPVTLPTNGKYTILVDPAGANTGSIKVTAYLVNDATGTITPTAEGATKLVSLPTPGQNARYTVAGTAGEAVSLQTTSSSFSGNYELEWRNPEGARMFTEAFSGSESAFVGPISFSMTGTYTLEVNPLRAATGATTITAYNPAPVTGSLTPSLEGDSKVVTIAYVGQRGLITFPATKGTLLTIKAKEATIANGWVQILDPTGATAVGQTNFTGTGASIEFAPEVTGTYTIRVEPERADTGTVKLIAYLGSRPLARRQSTPGARTVPGAAPQRSTRPKPSSDHTSTHATQFIPRPHRSAIPSYARLFNAARRPWTAPPASKHGPGPAWSSLQPPTPWATLAPLQAEFGVTGIAGQVLSISGLPLAGIPITIDSSTAATTTDSSGRFLLWSHVTGGHKVLIVGSPAQPHGSRYGTYEIGVDVAKRHTTILPATIWLTPLSAAGDHHIASPTTRETRLTTPEIPGLEVRLPAGSVITDASGHTVHSLNITAIPTDRPPFQLPAFVQVPVYFTVQPGRAYINKGAQIIYPNWTHMAAGARVPFWNYEADNRGWYVYGYGSVTPDGKQVVPDPSVRVWEFTGAMISGSPTPPVSGPNHGGGSFGADPVDLHTGLYVYRRQDLMLPDTIPVVVERTYRQGDANSYSFGVGTTSLYDMRLWSVNNYHEADLILPDGGRVHYVRTSPGTGFTEAVYEAQNNPGTFYASKIRWDTPNSQWDLTLTSGLTYVFGEFAPLQAIRDRYGNQLTLTRETGPTGRIIQITSPHGRWAKFSYDSSNRINEVTDNGGRALKYAYNEAGLLEKATDAAGRATSYEYNPEHQLKGITDGRGKTYVETEYDANGRVAKQTLADGGIYKLAYTLNGAKEVEATTVTDPRKLERRVTFNSAGLPTADTSALGTAEQQTTTFEPQTGTGLPLGVTDARGRKTSYKYDSLGNTTQMTLLSGTASARTTEYGYEPGTNLRTSSTDALKHTTTYHYGAHGELLSRTDALGHKTSYEYNPEGQPTEIIDDLGHTSKLGYETGDLTSASDALGHTTRRFVDALGRVTATTAPNGNQNSYEYNGDNQLAKQTDALGASVTYEYDGDGNLTTTTDPNTNKATATYDALDRLESETDGLKHAETAVYDKDGNLVERTDRNGKLAKFSYDSLNRLGEARFGVSGETAESTLAYSYDNGNRLTKVIDSVAGTFTPEYDEFNRLKSLAAPNGTVGYEYNEADRRTAMTAPGQVALKYKYDEANRLTELKRGTQTVTLAYDAANRRTATTLPDGIEEQYGYDETNELTSLSYKTGATKLGELDYSYYPGGEREAVWGSYARTGLPAAVSSATYNAGNEQTERNGKKATYDSNGNLISDGTSEYKWNSRGQLATISGGTAATFTYDPFGQRLSKTFAGTTTKLVNDGPNAIQETHGSVTINLLDGLGADHTFGRTTSSTTESLLTDALGSTIALASSKAKVETSYTYDPFGNATHEGAASENTIQYTGRESDASALQYNRARYYSPASSRFISQDPLGASANGPNLYRYAVNSPTNATDPYGTQIPTPGPGASSESGPAGASAPAPGGASGSVGPGSSGGAGVGAGGGVGGAGAPGGFGPGPGGCRGSTKHGGLGEVSTCRDYTTVEEDERRQRAEREEEAADQEERERREVVGRCVGGIGVSAVEGGVASAEVVKGVLGTFTPVRAVVSCAGGIYGPAITSGATGVVKAVLE